jgi:hypothetical protein
MVASTQYAVSVIAALVCFGCAFKPTWDDVTVLLERRYAPRNVFCEVGAVEVREGRYLDLATHVTRTGCLGTLRAHKFIETECTEPNSYNGCGRIELKTLLSQARIVGSHLEVPCGTATVIPKTVSRGIWGASIACRRVIKLDDFLADDGASCELRPKERNADLGEQTVTWKLGAWVLSSETPAFSWGSGAPSSSSR